jgi:O-antigen/teichoic acid export membrane protein
VARAAAVNSRAWQRRAHLGPGSQAVLATAGSSLVVYALSVLTGPVLARALGDEGRGSLAAVVVPTQLLAWVAGLGMPTATGYFAASVPRRQLVASAWAITAVVAAPLAVVGMVLAPRFLASHDPLTVGWFRALLVATVLLVPTYAALDHLNGSGQVRRFNAVRHLIPLSNAAGVLIAALAGRLTLTVALAVATVANVGGALVVLGFTRSFPGRGFRLGVFLMEARYGARAVVGDVAHLLVGRLDQVLMVSLVAPAQLGVYAVAATASAVSGSISNGLALATFPRIRRALTTAERDAATFRAAAGMFAVSGAIAAAVAIAAPLGLPLLFGDGFEAAVRPLWWLLPGQICFDVGSVLGARLRADGLPGRATLGHCAAAAVTVFVAYPAVAARGIEGAAVVTTVSQAVFLAVVGAALFLLRRRARRWPAPPPQGVSAVTVQPPAIPVSAGLWFAQPAAASDCFRAATPQTATSPQPAPAEPGASTLGLQAAPRPLTVGAEVGADGGALGPGADTGPRHDRNGPGDGDTGSGWIPVQI